MRIAILMACYNRREKTLACLASLSQNRLPRQCSLRVFLTDDASTDGTAVSVTERFPDVEILPGTGDLFWNRGMHLAFARALSIGFDAYIWLNDDTLLYQNGVELLLSTLEKGSAGGTRPAVVIGSTCDPATKRITYGGVVAKGPLRPFTYRLIEPQSRPVECDTMNGNCVLVPGEIAEAIGNLEYSYKHAMGDTDYGLRVRRAGFKLLVAPGYVGTCAKNLNRGSFTDRSLSRLQRLKLMMGPKGLPPASWLLFTRRHAPILWPLYFVWPYVSVLLKRRHRVPAVI